MDNHNHIVIIAAAVLIAASCSPKIVERVKYVTEYRNVYQRDTTVQHDSVFIREWIKGDTVHHYEFRDRYVYRDRVIRDTVFKADSVAIEHIKTEYVEQPLSWSKRAKIRAFWWLVLSVAGLGVWTFRKPIFGWFTKIWKLIF